MWEKLLPYPTLSLTARTSCSPWRGRSHSYSSTGRSFLYFRQSTVPQDGRRHHPSVTVGYETTRGSGWPSRPSPFTTGPASPWSHGRRRGQKF